MVSEIADVAVIGAGAAGLMSSISAARTGERRLMTLLLDSRLKIGAKILISGGTRCNVTNVRVDPSDYEGGPRHFIKHVLEAFTPNETMRFFQEIGVELVLEPTGKYFPTTHSGKTVLEALMREAENAGVRLECGMKVTGVRKQNDFFVVEGRSPSGQAFRRSARRVILSTGGLSYPETGSDGGGYEIAQYFGHSIVPTAPALTPLLTNDKDWTSLSGLTLDVKLSFFSDRRKEAESEGSFLFTHFGFSGPAALDISRHFSKTPKENSPSITVNFMPSMTEEDFLKIALGTTEAHPKKMTRNFLSEEGGIPSRLAEIFLKKCGAGASSLLGNFSPSGTRKWVHALYHLPLEISGVYGYKKAEVTAGGVDLKEIQVSTMESKLVPGLYFSGEIADVDGRIGGFNFQWAWSSGTLAGRSAARSLLDLLPAEEA